MDGMGWNKVGLNISVDQASAVEGEEDPARGLSSFNALHVALLHLTSADKGQQPTFKLLEITDFVGWLSKEMEQENIGNWAMNEFQRYSIYNYIYIIYSVYILYGLKWLGSKRNSLDLCNKVDVFTLYHGIHHHLKGEYSWVTFGRPSKSPKSKQKL